MPYYEYDHTYYDRPPRPYHPRSSSRSPYHLEDLYAALPGELVWAATYPARINRDVPPLMDQSEDREEPPAESRKRREKKSSGPTQTEDGGGGEGSRDATNRGKQTDSKTLAIARRSPSGANPQVAIRLRERRLIETRLLLTQLHAQLETAYNVYKSLDDRFKKHCDTVTSFANADTLDRVWTDMVQLELRQWEAQSEKPADFDSVTAQIGLCLRHLQSAEKERLPPVPGFHEKNAVIERHIRKVIKDVEEIVELAERAHMNHDACGYLVWYLNRAWASSDPESVVWKGLLGNLPAAEKAYAPTNTSSN
ncbi:hypothetical protein CH063_08075 [Colletotrichum higginsianum]|uniref:Uncharacterized protein n=2 Tax=Colletotrichum higginsianum TaxID=80884 RepID=H1V8H2_COLHI|nr:hypothetical protein CH63R_05727 [Colletotrichum higginsianum IMI 349063]OBR10035.1 hypothetical protein CH63R_05727 [Colletotrichum higginsianum IMI 349063]TID06452.1 hypothetical protein CH35J_001394 [Colletotrichum higginsianum]GJD02941.1 hypothetical protein ColKHC_11766 [Colletotrichum higginsianum]CCF36525.1 hypothetical protein CH063_08075 [Colletotrichum higginsianum]